MAQVQQNQNIFDICLQEFGTLENLFVDILEPNKIELDSKLRTSQIININNRNKGNETIKKQIQEQGLVFSNEDIEKITIENYIFEDDNNYIFEDGNNYIYE